MKRVVVLGSGMSVGPLVSYFHGRGYRVTVACRRPELGRALAGGLPGVTVTSLDLDDPGAVIAPLLAEHDLVASFVPGAYQPRVAAACLEARRPLVVSCHHHYFSAFPGGMAALDDGAKRAGIPIVTELGVDCGYLGLLAKRDIDRLVARGRRVRSISFHTGVLPGRYVNPFDYAFFWAAKKAALSYVAPKKGKADFIRGGARVSVDKHDVYATPALVELPGGALETHPNLDSGGFQYAGPYGVEDADAIFHGTLRHVGWCSVMTALIGLGFDALEPRPDLVGLPFRAVVLKLVGADSRVLADDRSAREAAAAKLGLRPYDDALLRLEWLGLFGERPAMQGSDGSPADLVTELLLERLGVFGYDSGVPSRVVNRFDLISVPADGRGGGPTERSTSVFDMRDDGRGHSLCSRLISQTTAIVGRQVLEGDLRGMTGLHHPYQSPIYAPVLGELEDEGIRVVVGTEGERCPGRAFTSVGASSC